MAMTLAQAFELIVPADRGVGFRAYDGSSAGPSDAVVTLDVRTPRAFIHGAPAHVRHFVGLPQVKRHGHHVGPVPLRQPADAGG